nr:cell division control protein Cdc6 [Methanomicrobia archaeon]
GSKCVLLYINNEVFDTQYRVFAYLARVFNKRVPMIGWPTDMVYSEFKAGIDTEDRCVIVILDEVDKLATKGDGALYNLSRINSELNNAKVSMIGISNDLTFTDLLDPRVKSSLGEEEIIFPPYNAEQLKDILDERAEKAFNDSVIDDTVIPLCAAFAAQEHGDARRALDLLRVSGEIAERTESDKVTEAHVRVANEKIEANRVVEVVKTLPLQSKIVLNSVLLLNRERNRRRFSSGEVYNMYRRLCNHLGMEPLTQLRVTDLVSELDILGLINAVIISRGRYGRTKEISLSVPEESVQPVLLEDYKLKAISNIRVRAQVTL